MKGAVPGDTEQGNTHSNIVLNCEVYAVCEEDTKLCTISRGVGDDIESFHSFLSSAPLPAKPYC